MDLSFRNASLEKQCTSEKALLKEWGAAIAPVLRRRIVQLAAAPSVAVLRSFPFCSVSTEPAGYFALDGDPSFVIRFAAVPGNTSSSASTKEEDITAIEIVEIKKI